MSKWSNLSIGDDFNYLKLTGDFFYVKKAKSTYANFTCECGKIKSLPVSSVVRGIFKSCGCKKIELLSKIGSTQIKHGCNRRGNKHPIYNSWNGMISRCYNIKRESYKDYGARGIIICEEWKHNFSEFFKWSLDNGWANGLSIERNNVNGNYEPSNCSWKTNAEQQNNKRRTMYITAFKETKSIEDWLDDSRCSITKSGLRKRLRNWSNAELAISKPVDIRFVRTKIKKCG